MRKIISWVKRKFSEREYSEHGMLLLISIIVGIGAGIGAAVFLWLLEKVQEISLSPEGLFSGISPYHLIFVPAIGGVIVGPLIYFFAHEAKGHGVPSVMEAVAVKGGKIRPQVALVKVIASAITIGSGGSAGSEGPIAQIGAGLGSTIGQVFKLSDDQLRALVACGAAGGIAAVFHAPIGGAIFAMEVILGRLHTMYFGAVVISSVVASVVSQFFQKGTAIFKVPPYELVSPWELLFYVLLGILAALGSLLFSRSLDLFETTSDRIPIPEYIKPMIGGLLVGLIGFYTYKYNGIPRIFDGGYATISQTLFGELSLQIAIGLLFLKILVTNLTLGSGGSGGIFAPSLFMGAMLGEGFGQILHGWFPQITAPPGAYALVGMAAFFSGAAHAPMTAILILFEMTGDYHIILPLMLATVVSTVLSRLISPDSIYTIKLTRRGIFLDRVEDIDVMQGITVSEAMSKNVDIVPMNMTLEALMEKFAITRRHSFPVVDQENRLVGLIYQKDVEKIFQQESDDEKTVADLMRSGEIYVAFPDEPMWKALRDMGKWGVKRLPVVESKESLKVIGMISGNDIIQAYNQAIAKRAQLQHRKEVLRLGKIDDYQFIHLKVSPDSFVVGKLLSDIDFPPDCLVVSIRRGRRLMVAHGSVAFQPGDEMTIFAANQYIPIIQDLFLGHSSTGTIKMDGGRYQYIEITISAEADCVGKPIREISLPDNCLIVNIRRGRSLIIPHGYHLLQPGDILTIYGLSHELEVAAKRLA